jgi:hypothetical protein
VSSLAFYDVPSVVSKEATMKRLLVVLVVLAGVLLLGSCTMMYSIFPSMDPILGTWDLTRIMLPSGMGGDDTWHNPVDYGISTSMIFTDDGRYTGTFDDGTPVALAGTWSGSYPVYTIVQTDGFDGVYVMTLSDDKKTGFINVGNGEAEQLTKAAD